MSALLKIRVGLIIRFSRGRFFHPFGLPIIFIVYHPPEPVGTTGSLEA